MDKVFDAKIRFFFVSVAVFFTFKPMIVHRIAMIFSLFLAGPLWAGEDADSLRRVLAATPVERRAALLLQAASAALQDQPEQASLYALQALHLAREHAKPAEEAQATYLIAESYVNREEY